MSESRPEEASEQEEDDRGHNARHEAAHAVVSVRLGLPLASTDIVRRTSSPDGRQVRVPPGYNAVASLGYTTLVKGTAEAWIDKLPDPIAKDSLERLAAQAAAGMVAEVDAGHQLGDAAHHDDFYRLVQLADVLGLGQSNQDPAVRGFIASAYVRAEKILHGDREGWDGVAQALLDRQALTGDEVRALLREAAGE